MIRAALLLSLPVAAAACAEPRWFVQPPGAPSARAPRAPLPPPPSPGPGSVAIVLERCEGAPSVEVTTPAGAVRVAREGDRVVASDGRRGPWLVLEAGERGLELDGRRYLGRIVVAPSAAGGLSVRNHVDFEVYVRGVVAREIAIWSAPAALLEAQAVAARSYARAQLLGRPHEMPRETLLDSTQDQAYDGEYVPDGPAAERVAARLAEAVEHTRGVVLTLRGRVLDARFHASCGGTTAAFEGVFPEADPGGMEPVPCPPCRREAAPVAASAGSGGTLAASAPAGLAWEWTAGPAELKALALALGIGRRVTSLVPVRHDAHGRWLEVRVAGDAGRVNTSATDLRRRLGWTHLKSASIATTDPPPGRPIQGSLTFHGRGRGHGVGLCQTGARALAEEGWSAERILAHYFPAAGRARLVNR